MNRQGGDNRLDLGSTSQKLVKSQRAELLCRLERQKRMSQGSKEALFHTNSKYQSLRQ